MIENSEEVISMQLEIAERMLRSGSTIDFVIKITKLSKEIIESRLPVLFEYQRGFEDGKSVTEKIFLENMVKHGFTNDQIYKVTGLDKYVIRRTNYLAKKAKEKELD
jgi:hypothetical protein